MRREDQSPEFQARSAEVQQEANRQAGCFQVVQDLGLMDRAQLGQGFQFDDDRLETEEIGLVEGAELSPLVDNRELDLPLKGDPDQSQLDGHRLLVNRFQETMPELPMNLHRGSDDRVCPRILITFHRGYAYSTWQD